MEYVKIEGQFPKFSHCAVTLGKFDGIHRGHRKLIQTILNRKKEYGELAVVMAFVSDRQTILTSEERRTLLEKMGVDILLECPLNDQIKHMKADVFIRQILKGDLQASCVVVGEDFRFGHERKGSPELLEKYGEKYDYETMELMEAVDIPVVAIGGITQENAHELNDCGIDGLSVVSAIMEAKNPKIASENLLKEFKAKNS